MYVQYLVADRLLLYASSSVTTTASTDVSGACVTATKVPVAVVSRYELIIGATTAVLSCTAVQYCSSLQQEWAWPAFTGGWGRGCSKQYILV